MPDCIRANTNVTSLAIGERIADFMRQALRPRTSLPRIPP